jgi:hypothetical protein
MRHYFIVILLLASLLSKAQPFLFCEKQVNQTNYSKITIPDAKGFFKSSIPKVKEGHYESKPLGGVQSSYTDILNIAYKKEGVIFHFMKGNTSGYASEEYVLRMISIYKKSPTVLTCDSLRVGDVVSLASLGLTTNDYIRDITMKAKYGYFVKNGIKYAVVIASKNKFGIDTQLKIKKIIIDFR